LDLAWGSGLFADPFQVGWILLLDYDQAVAFVFFLSNFCLFVDLSVTGTSGLGGFFPADTRRLF